MNTGLLTNMFTGNAGAGSVTANFASKAQKNPNSIAKPAKARSTNPPEVPTTDNSQPIAQYEPDNEPLKTFESALAEKKVSGDLQNQPEIPKAVKQSSDKSGSDVVIPAVSLLAAHLNKAEGETQIPQLDKLVIAKKTPVIQINANDITLEMPVVVAKKTVTADIAPTSKGEQILPADTSKTTNNQQTGAEEVPQAASSDTSKTTTNQQTGAEVEPQVTTDDTSTVVTDTSVVQSPSPNPKPDVPTAEIQNLPTKPAASRTVQEVPTPRGQNGQQKLSGEPTSDPAVEKLPVSNEKPSQDTSVAVPKAQINGVIDQKTPDSNTANGQNTQNGNTANGQNTQNGNIANGQNTPESKSKQFEMSAGTKPQQENIPDTSAAKDITSVADQATAGQTQKTSDLLPDQTQNSGVEISEQIIGDNSIQTSTTQQSPMVAATAKTAGNTNFDATVGQQIQESAQIALGSSSKQIVILLNPPELGNVAIKFQEQGDGITGMLQVDRPQTKAQIEQALPEIIQNLQNAGIQIKKVEVVLANQQEQYSAKDQSAAQGQGTFAGNQNTPDQRSNTNNPAYNEWLPSNEIYGGYTEHQQQLTETSINMLV